MTPAEFLDILHVAERLKDTPRHCTTSKRRVESVAEHSWRISLMAFLLKDDLTYNEIEEKTGASTATISRVSRALNYGSGGYEMMLERLSEEEA